MLIGQFILNIGWYKQNISFALNGTINLSSDSNQMVFGRQYLSSNFILCEQINLEALIP